MKSTAIMTPTTRRNRNQFAPQSVVFACLLLTCILSLNVFGATTYYYAGADQADWNSLGSWKDVNGVSQTSWSDNNTYVIDPNQTLGGGATAGSKVDITNGQFNADNLTIESGGRVVLDSTPGGKVDELTLNGGQIANYSQTGIRSWGDGNDDKIILGAGTTGSHLPPSAEVMVEWPASLAARAQSQAMRAYPPSGRKPCSCMNSNCATPGRNGLSRQAIV